MCSKNSNIIDMEDNANVSVDAIGDEMKILPYLVEMIKIVSDDKNASNKSIEKIHRILRRKYHICPSKRNIRLVYQKYMSNIDIPYILQRWMVKRNGRSKSGVLVVTTVLAPNWEKTTHRKGGSFSCSKNCSYCPQETNLEGDATQPRSYLSNEPAMLRAIRHSFDARGQFWDRINSYIYTGNIDINDKSSKKLEVIVSGGTWECFPEDYRDSYITELYWSANTYGLTKDRDMLSLEEEIKINETSPYRIIGLTLETRPDFINKYNIQKYNKYGVTRIQIGVQHYDDTILKKVNRDCYLKDTIKAIHLLKQACFKVVVHLMPDLPGSSPELDKWMFKQAVNNPNLQFDDLKIYPTAVCQSIDPKLVVKSDILDWYNQGIYVPYAEKNLMDLIDVIAYFLENVNPWVRVQRIVRDIPSQSIAAGYQKKSNLRQMITQHMDKKKTSTCEIRSMEVGDSKFLDYKARLVVRKYRASNGDEYHISMEAYSNNNNFKYYMFIIYSWIYWFVTGNMIFWSGSKKKKDYCALFGFLRLRIDPNPGGNYIKKSKILG